MSIAKEYFEKKIGNPELYFPRKWGEKGAHEAIRPTRPMDVIELRKSIIDGSLRIPVKLTESHYKLYNLIFRRFMASQARPSILKKIVFKAKAGDLETTSELILNEAEPGFATILGIKQYPVLLEYAKRKKIPIDTEKIAVYRGSVHRLYTQGEIIKDMREKGLGRPSTYAKIVESIRRHGYTILSKKRKFLVPTKMGMEVSNYLSTAYPMLVSETTTIELEKNMDKIESGKESYIRLLKKLHELMNNLGLLEEREELLYSTIPSSIMDEAMS
jgi:reverse gyrase